MRRIKREFPVSWPPAPLPKKPKHFRQLTLEQVRMEAKRHKPNSAAETHLTSSSNQSSASFVALRPSNTVSAAATNALPVRVKAEPSDSYQDSKRTMQTASSVRGSVSRPSGVASGGSNSRTTHPGSITPTKPQVADGFLQWACFGCHKVVVQIPSAVKEALLSEVPFLALNLLRLRAPLCLAYIVDFKDLNSPQISSRVPAGAVRSIRTDELPGLRLEPDQTLTFYSNEDKRVYRFLFCTSCFPILVIVGVTIIGVTSETTLQWLNKTLLFTALTKPTWVRDPGTDTPMAGSIHPSPFLASATAGMAPITGVGRDARPTAAAPFPAATAINMQHARPTGLLPSVARGATAGNSSRPTYSHNTNTRTPASRSTSNSSSGSAGFRSRRSTAPPAPAPPHITWITGPLATSAPPPPLANDNNASSAGSSSAAVNHPVVKVEPQQDEENKVTPSRTSVSPKAMVVMGPPAPLTGKMLQKGASPSPPAARKGSAPLLPHIVYDTPDSQRYLDIPESQLNH